MKCYSYTNIIKEINTKLKKNTSEKIKSSEVFFQLLSKNKGSMRDKRAFMSN